MIQVRNAYKCFEKGNRALDSLCINIDKGSIYGLVGTNGAGKTTVIRCIMGILRLDDGEILVDDKSVYDNEPVKQRIGYVADDPFFFRGYSLREMGKYTAGIYRSWNEERFRAMIRDFSLDDKVKLSSYSKGMKKQAALILALSVMPDYLVLDEPIDGLDPIMRRKSWKYIINDVAEREMTVLVSSHNLREMEGYCDHIGIISDGKMVIERDLEDLKSDVNKVQVAFRNGEENSFARAVEGMKVISHEKRGSVDVAVIREPSEKILEAFGEYDTPVMDLLPLTLEEIFICELGGDSNEITAVL